VGRLGPCFVAVVDLTERPTTASARRATKKTIVTAVTGSAPAFTCGVVALVDRQQSCAVVSVMVDARSAGAARSPKWLGRRRAHVLALRLFANDSLTSVPRLLNVATRCVWPSKM
jgi:hypothetical protein